MQPQNSLFKESIIKFDSERYTLFFPCEGEKFDFFFSFAKVAIILTILTVSVKLT